MLYTGMSRFLWKSDVLWDCILFVASRRGAIVSILPHEEAEALTRPHAFVLKSIRITFPLLVTARYAWHSVVEILIKIGCLKKILSRTPRVGGSWLSHVVSILSRGEAEALTRPHASVLKSIQIPFPLLVKARYAWHSVVEILIKIGCLKKNKDFISGTTFRGILVGSSSFHFATRRTWGSNTAARVCFKVNSKSVFTFDNGQVCLTLGCQNQG